MKITYDKEVDCAYIEFISEGVAEHFINHISPRDEFDETFEMNLNIAADGKLMGIEIVFASFAFTQEMLDSFQPL